MSKTVSKSALTAGVVLAMAFTFSCSSPDDGEGGDGKGGSSSSLGGGDLPSSSSVGYTGSYGSVTYEGQTYKTVIIGEQTWLAENLNYEAEGSRCYDNDPANCAKYGRLYNWETAMMVCPSGWHLPTRAEWDALLTYAGGSTSGTKLKSTSGWNLNGTDQYGFSALPGGNSLSYGSSFNGIGYEGFWWTASEYGSGGQAYFQKMRTGFVEDNHLHKSEWFSVRCLQD